MQPLQQIEIPQLAQPVLPPVFADWFAARGWQPREHQLSLLEHALRGESVLLVAPTGGGKTLAGFLPSLIELAAVPRRARRRALHTLYISPLKALAVDVARNLEAPVAEMGLDVRVETRTGDTPASRRLRQRHSPPDILLTTPEQFALLLSSKDAPRLFASIRAVVLDELHAASNSKRGDLLALGLSRLQQMAPTHRRIGLSATVADPAALQRFLVPQPVIGEARSALVVGRAGAKPDVSILSSDAYVPWAGQLPCPVCGAPAVKLTMDVTGPGGSAAPDAVHHHPDGTVCRIPGKRSLKR